MKLAIQESLLPGETILQKMQNAQKIGVTGVEIDAKDLAQRITEIQGAMQSTGVAIAAVNAGNTQILHPGFAERDKAIAAIRTAMTDALDLDSGQVVFIPHYATAPVLPDLRPYKSAVELEAEMLVTQLKATLSDLAYALGAHLHMLVVSKQRAHLINTLYRAHVIYDKAGSQPHLHIAADICDLHSEEENVMAALAEYAQYIGYVHVADTGRRIPGMGDVDFATVFKALQVVNYDGWLTLACTVPNINDPEYMEDLEYCITSLREAMG